MRSLAWSGNSFIDPLWRSAAELPSKYTVFGRGMRHHVRGNRRPATAIGAAHAYKRAGGLRRPSAELRRPRVPLRHRARRYDLPDGSGPWAPITFQRQRPRHRVPALGTESRSRSRSTSRTRRRRRARGRLSSRRPCPRSGKRRRNESQPGPRLRLYQRRSLGNVLVPH